MNLVFDFLAGRIPVEDFKKEWYSDEKLRNWINNLVDLNAPLDPMWEKYPYQGYRAAIHSHYGGSVEEFIRYSDEAEKKCKSKPITRIGWAFNAIASVVIIAYPNAEITQIYSDEVDLYYDLCGDVYGGAEVDEIIERIVSKYPRSLGKTKRRKMAKQEIKHVFHIKNRYPRWIQEPDWPMGVNSPMIFISQAYTTGIIYTE